MKCFINGWRTLNLKNYSSSTHPLDWFKIKPISLIYVLTKKGGDQMSDQEQSIKAGASANIIPGKIGIWSSRQGLEL
jgi:hypothetical protein